MPPIGPISSVYPSGVAFEAISVPMVAPAPGRFSMTIAWPRRPLNFSPTVRATMSTPPPGGKGAMNRIGLVGYCAAAAAAKATKPAATAIRRTTIGTGFPFAAEEGLDVIIHRAFIFPRRGPIDQLTIKDGVVHAGGRTSSYGALVAGNVLHVAAQPQSPLK